MVEPQARRRSSLARRLIQTVARARLFERGQHLLVALSGGPDSTALVLLLHELSSAWRLTLTAVHFNYGLRGRESDDDEAFVVRLCGDLGIPLITRRIDLTDQRKRQSIQAAARDSRYRAMKAVAQGLSVNRVVLGHTADDQAETLLMWMLRGAGVTGMAGIPSQREGLFVRPLLSTTREEILAYLEAKRQPFRRDSSNDKPIYFRNRIRSELLPVVKRLAPAAVRVLQRQADVVAEEDRCLEQMAADLRATLIKAAGPGCHRLGREEFLALPCALQRRLIRLVLRGLHPRLQAPRFAIVEATVRFVRTADSGAELQLGIARLSRERDVIRIASLDRDRGGEKGEAAPALVEIPIVVPSRTHWAGTGQQIHVQLLARRDAGRVLGDRDQHTAVFDADRVSEPLLLRNWRPGDRFYPSGMKGKSKKLQDFFTDVKLPRRERDFVPLLVTGRDIMWVIGIRQDERFTPRASTVRCLVAQATNQKSEGGTR